eukprot:7446754-Pyramimonas_sp.AAC.1
MAQFKSTTSECTSSGSSSSVDVDVDEDGLDDLDLGGIEYEGSIRTNISTNLNVKSSTGCSIKQPDDDTVANDDRALGFLRGGRFSPSIISPYLEPATPPSKA